MRKKKINNRVGSSNKEVKPFKYMKFTKCDKSRTIKLGIYKDKDIYEDLSMLKNNMVETQQDDDVDTDEDVLRSGQA